MAGLIYTPPGSEKTVFDRIFAFIQRMFGPLIRLQWTLELLCVIYPIEVALRLWYHLNPQLYSERLRIKRLTEGAIAPKGDRFVLFVVYARSTIPPFTQTLLDAVGRSRLNLVISTNAKITSELRERLRSQCCLLIERTDLGRDFGGYKDGISIITRRFGTPQRLVLLNDSLFYFERGLDECLSKLDGDDDLIGMTEVFEYHYHIGSFALSFGRRVLKDRRFRRYWRRYRPVSTRRWSIQYGEVGLTKALMKASFRPTILYHGAQLLPFFEKQQVRDFLESVRFLPTEYRRRLYSEFDDVHNNQTNRSLDAIGTLSKSIWRLGRNKEPLHVDLRAANIQEMLEINRLTASTQLDRDNWVVKTLGHRIVSAIVRRNQMHAGCFLFMRYLGMPVFKRDVFFREVFRLEEIEDFLAQLQEPLRDEVAAHLRQKGSQKYLRGLASVLVKHGSI